MGKAVRAGALLLLITTLVWSTTLWRWQTTGRVLRAEDVFLNLVGVPLAATAALLLASSAWAGATGEALKPLAMLHRASLVRRNHSADAAGRSSHATAAQVLDDALAASGASPGEVLALACVRPPLAPAETAPALAREPAGPA